MIFYARRFFVPALLALVSCKPMDQAPSRMLKTSAGDKDREPRWPLPDALMSISGAVGPRVEAYRSYVNGLSPSERMEFAEDASISLDQNGVNSDRIIVKFKSIDAQKSLLKVLKTTSIVRDFKIINAKLLKIPASKDNVELLAHMGALKELSEVEYAEPDNKIKIIAAADDTRFGEQWALPKISAVTAWNTSTGSKNVRVGVIDTGINYRHPDLAENIWSNPGEIGIDASGQEKSTNGVDDDGNGYIDDHRGWDFLQNDNDPMDGHGHGTHVAGTIGAVGNNKLGISGVNWSTSLVPLRFLDENGFGSTSNAILAIEYATTLKLEITNNSWGGGSYSLAMEEAIKANQDAGGLFVAAAGNNRSDNDLNPTYPACHPVQSIISVAALDNRDQLATFSNYGKKSVHLAAPGVNILSTVGDNYREMSGTSMAAPHVAGAAALVKAVWPNYTNHQIKAKLIESVDGISNPTVDGKLISGGRLNVARALGGVPATLNLSSVSPKIGSPAGGSKITVIGQGIQPGIEVRVGSGLCQSLQVLSTSELTCIVPAFGFEGFQDITGTNPDGSKSSISKAFQYNFPPSISFVNPSSGVVTGGIRITLRGSRLAPKTQVSVGGKTCVQMRVASTQNVSCVVQPHSEGQHRVVVTNQLGQESSEDVQFSYFTPTRITSVTPTVGPLSGGNAITVLGTGFRSGARVQVGSANCSNVSLVSSTELKCQISGTARAGSVTVTVTNTDGQRAALANAYTFRAAPRLQSISPGRGTPVGGIVLALQGSGFVRGAAVKVGTVDCSAVKWTSASRMSCTLPALSPGSYSVFVVNPEGQVSPAQAAATFQVDSEKWVQTNGSSCVSVCQGQGYVSATDKTGASCSSGEIVPNSARGVIDYRNGCKPNRTCSGQGPVNGAASEGGFCYGPGQAKNNEKTDVTMGCYCRYQW